MNICKLSTLENLPSLPTLFKLSLNDNNLTSITGLAEKCPTLLELYLSGNKKISTLDQLDEISKLKSLLKAGVRDGIDMSIYGSWSKLKCRWITQKSIQTTIFLS